MPVSRRRETHVVTPLHDERPATADALARYSILPSEHELPLPLPGRLAEYAPPLHRFDFD